MRYGYAKVGRNMALNPRDWGVVGGDDEPPLLLKDLARRNPQHEFIIVGRNSGDAPASLGYPPNVVNPWQELREIIGKEVRGKDAKGVVEVYDHHTLDWFRDLDGMVVWAGQHGTSNTPIPPVGKDWHEQLTSPQISFVNYASYIIRGINVFRREDPHNREEVWLHPDPRNYVKCRDLKWPPRNPMLCQFNFERHDKHERYGDTRSPSDFGFDAEWEGDHVWKARHRYMYSRLEICGVLPHHVPSAFADTWEERRHFGLFINEARSYVKWSRLDALRDWVLPLQPYFINGKWSEESLKKLGVDIQPAPAEMYYDRLRSVKSTFTTPSSGSGWATTKPWQAFATGTVCFFHPQYDTQGHIIPTLEQVNRGHVESETMQALAKWLRVREPEDLAKRVKAVNESRDTWLWLATMQRRLYDWASETSWHLQLIEERLGIR